MTSIDNCLKYDGKATTSLCAECKTGNYSKGNSCEERILSKTIQNCKTLNPKSEECEICEDSFILSGDKLKCL